jgi:hypothetical protein
MDTLSFVIGHNKGYKQGRAKGGFLSSSSFKPYCYSCTIILYGCTYEFFVVFFVYR